MKEFFPDHAFETSKQLVKNWKQKGGGRGGGFEYWSRFTQEFGEVRASRIKKGKLLKNRSLGFAREILFSFTFKKKKKKAKSALVLDF